MKPTYKIGDLVVFVDSIKDSTIRTVDETPSFDGRFVILDGFKHQYSVDFIRPVTTEERQLGRRIHTNPVQEEAAQLMDKLVDFCSLNIPFEVSNQANSLIRSLKVGEDYANLNSISADFIKRHSALLAPPVDLENLQKEVDNH